MSLALSPYPSDYRTAFAFSAIPYPPPPSARLAARFPFREGDGLTTFHTHAAERVRPCLSAGGRAVCGRAAVDPYSGPLTFWFEPATPASGHSTLGSFQLTTFISSSCSWPYRPTRPPTALVLAVTHSPHGRRASSMLGIPCPEGFPPSIALRQAPVGLRGQNPESVPHIAPATAFRVPTNVCATSCRTTAKMTANAVDNHGPLRRRPRLWRRV